jgi:hypothetical protein
MDREFLNDLGAAISNLLLWSKILSGLPVPDKIKYFNADELTEKTEQDAMKNTITVPDAIDLETFLANASEQWEKLHKSPTRKKPALNNYIMTDPGRCCIIHNPSRVYAVLGRIGVVAQLASETGGSYNGS